MRDVGLLELLDTWLDGRPTDGLRMYGLPMLWWGRLGKTLQFVGAAAVIVEIIGAPRLKELGESLHTSTSLEKRISAARERRLAKERERHWFMGCFMVFPLYFIVVPIWVIYNVVAWILNPDAVTEHEHRAQVTLLLAVLFPVVVLVAYRLGILLMLGALRLAAGVGLIIDLVVVRPMAWALNRTGWDRRAQIVGFGCVAIGFSLDLLAS